MPVAVFFCLKYHHVFIKFVFTPLYPTLLFLFPREEETGAVLIFIVILLTSLQHQSKRSGISLNFGLFLHISRRALSRNREEGNFTKPSGTFQGKVPASLTAALLVLGGRRADGCARPPPRSRAGGHLPHRRATAPAVRTAERAKSLAVNSSD